MQFRLVRLKNHFPGIRISYGVWTSLISHVWTGWIVVLLNKVLGSFSNDGNSSATTTNIVDTAAAVAATTIERGSNVTVCVVLFLYDIISSTSIQQDNTMSISSTPTAAVENPFHQWALVRLHSTTEQQGSDDVERRTGAWQQHPSTTNEQEDSPLRSSSPPNNHLKSSSTSPANTASTNI